MEKQEQVYTQIIDFYDFAENLLDTVEQCNHEDPVSQLDFIEPLVEKVEIAVDSLAEEYRMFLRTGKKPGLIVRRKIAKSFKDIYEVLGECKRINNIKAQK